MLPQAFQTGQIHPYMYVIACQYSTRLLELSINKGLSQHLEMQANWSLIPKPSLKPSSTPAIVLYTSHVCVNQPQLRASAVSICGAMLWDTIWKRLTRVYNSIVRSSVSSTRGCKPHCTEDTITQLHHTRRRGLARAIKRRNDEVGSTCTDWFTFSALQGIITCTNTYSYTNGSLRPSWWNW